MNVNWRGLAAYLTSGSRSFWIWFFLFVLPFVSVFIWHAQSDLETAFRFEGMLQQLGGLVFVAVGLNDMQSAFNVESLTSRIRNHIAGAWKFIGRTSVTSSMQLESCVSTATLSGATISVGVPADATLEQRVEFLERQAKDMHNALERQRASLQTEAKRLDQALLDEETKREQADKALKEMLKEISTGGIVLEWIGLLWLIQGTILVGIPSELASCFA